MFKTLSLLKDDIKKKHFNRVCEKLTDINYYEKRFNKILANK